jgi:PleD family two-component response regulator
MTRDIHSIVNAADLALYRAKSAGRNTVSALQLA